MSGHDEVERALRADAASLTPPAVTLDASAAARGARRRRLPAQAAVGTLSVLAVVGFGGLAVSALPQFSASDSVTDAGGESPADAPEAGPLASPETTEPDDGGGSEDLDGEGGAGGEPDESGADNGGSEEGSDGDTAWSLFACGDAPPPVGHGADVGLALEIAPLDVSQATGSTLAVTLTVTNVSEARITGTSAMRPFLALASEGAIVWHTAGGMDAVAVPLDLSPGESLRYESHLELRVCDGPAGDAPFPNDLPLAPPGTYEVVAALDVAVQGQTTQPRNTEVVISPRASLVLDAELLP